MIKHNLFSSFVSSAAFFVFLVINKASSSKILMTGAQVRSHIFEQLAVAEELAARGHDVYFGVAARYERIASIEEKGIKVITYQMPLDVPYMASDDVEKFTASMIFNGFDSAARMKQQLTDIPPGLNRDCRYMMEDDSFIETVKGIGFDIAIVEAFVIFPCTLILPKHIGVPFVTIAGFYFPWDIRSPALPSFHPLGIFPENRNPRTFKDRFVSFFIYLTFEFNLVIKWDANVELLEKYAVGVSSWKQLLLEAELFILTCDHHLDNILPLMPNFIRLPGVSGQSSKPLPADLEQLVTTAKEGVIVMSFGSGVTGMPDDIVKKFLDAFGQLKQTVIAKIRVPQGWTVPENVHILSWLPQNDLLAHPNTRLFVTHCGNGGQYEALHHGVPMVGFPLFAEQHINALRVLEKGFGLTLDIHSFTSSQLFNNIQEILTNTNYTTAIRKISAVLRDEPMSPGEKASFWIEHVIKHGGKHLRSIAMDMPTYQFLMFDVIGLVFIILNLFFSLASLIVVCIGRKLFSKRSERTVNKKNKEQ